nr:MAG TPA: tail collar fiber protein [Caudoviricetes sp.]
MANYIGWILTNKGRELLAKAINNETKINITKFKIGAGYNTGNDRELTDLLDKRNEFPVNSYERKENGIVEFTFIVSNKTGSGTSTITNSYKISEMGIYAQDDSGTEILYAYNKGTDGDYIPVYNGKNAIDIVEKCIIIIDQAATLNVTIDNSMTYLTRESADKRYLEIQALAKIIGLEFGGNIQDTGTKTTGKFYYDKALKYFYECIMNNSLTYNDGSKFRAISNKPILDKVENLFKVEVLSMTNLLGYITGTDTTEWYVNLPSHIKKDKVISVTNINQASWFEYCNLDIDSNCIRVGSKGNASNVPVKNIKVLVAYFT